MCVEKFISTQYPGHPFEANPALDALYNALERLGYEASAEERALRDGTHELYARKEVS